VKIIFKCIIEKSIMNVWTRRSRLCIWPEPNVVVEWLTLLLRIDRSRVQILDWIPAILTGSFVLFLSFSRKLLG
jgi:hypothetical protein